VNVLKEDGYMAEDQPLFSMNSLMGDYLESFIRSPYDYFFQNMRDSQWRHDIQLMIHQVVEHYFQLPRQIQNSISIMKLIDRYRAELSPEVFESPIHYCMVLVKITDHLLQLLPVERKQMPQVFFYKRRETILQPWESLVSLTVELTESSNKIFVVEKYLWEADQAMLECFQYMLAIYSLKVFGKLPEKVKIVTLLDGKTHSFSPTMEDVKYGYSYLKTMKKKRPFINR
jgi:hypothetical protein